MMMIMMMKIMRMFQVSTMIMMMTLDGVQVGGAHDADLAEAGLAVKKKEDLPPPVVGAAATVAVMKIVINKAVPDQMAAATGAAAAMMKEGSLQQEDVVVTAATIAAAMMKEGLARAATVTAAAMMIAIVMTKEGLAQPGAVAVTRMMIAIAMTRADSAAKEEAGHQDRDAEVHPVTAVRLQETDAAVHQELQAVLPGVYPPVTGRRPKKQNPEEENLPGKNRIAKKGAPRFLLCHFLIFKYYYYEKKYCLQWEPGF